MVSARFFSRSIRNLQPVPAGPPLLDLALPVWPPTTSWTTAAGARRREGRPQDEMPEQVGDTADRVRNERTEEQHERAMLLRSEARCDELISPRYRKVLFLVYIEGMRGRGGRQDAGPAPGNDQESPANADATRCVGILVAPQPGALRRASNALS